MSETSAARIEPETGLVTAPDLRIATMNIRGGGRVGKGWPRLLGAFAPDILLVQESSCPTDHLPPLLLSNEVGRVTWEAVAHGKWGSGVYVRNGLLTPAYSRDFAGWLVGGTVESNAPAGSANRPLGIFSLHAPSRGTYHRAVHAMLDELAPRLAGCDLVLGGDFNMTIAHSRPGDEPATMPNDRAVIDRLEGEFGLVNCWRHAHPEDRLVQTLRWGPQPRVEFHCDAIFVPRRWASGLRACVCFCNDDWRGASDHFPIVADFCFNDPIADQTADRNAAKSPASSGSIAD